MNMLSFTYKVINSKRSPNLYKNQCLALSKCTSIRLPAKKNRLTDAICYRMIPQIDHQADATCYRMIPPVHHQAV